MSLFRDAHAQFAQLGAAVLAVSIDSVYSQKGWVEKLGGLPFPLASDANRELGRTLGFLLPEVAGIREVYFRSVCLLDAAGTIRWKWGVDTRTQPDIPQVLAEVEKVAGPR